MPDLDQSGQGYQGVKVYLGPSLGWVQAQVGSQIYVTTGGNFIVPPGIQTVFVNIAATVNVQLPLVSLWVREPYYQPATAFNRSLWVKDFGGHATSFNITVTCAGSDTIDGLNMFTIIQDFAVLRLYPLNDLTGWFNA